VTDTMTYGQIEDALRAAIAQTLADGGGDETAWVWVIDFSDTFVVYEVEYDQYVQDNYTIDDDGNVTLAGDPQPVKSVTTYEPVGEAKGYSGRIEHRGRTARSRDRREIPTVRVKAEPLTYTATAAIPTSGTCSWLRSARTRSSAFSGTARRWTSSPGSGTIGRGGRCEPVTWSTGRSQTGPTVSAATSLPRCG
jgi:hypothetical protein